MAEARAGWDAATLERLIVKGLTRYYYGIDDEVRRAPVAAEPPLTGTGRRPPYHDFVHDVAPLAASSPPTRGANGRR